MNALVDPDDDDADNAFPGEYEGERDSHGTSCAGIIAMEKSNDVCGVGVAYLSRIIGEYYNNNSYNGIIIVESILVKIW